MKNAVVTGIGVLLPAIDSLEALWNSQLTDCAQPRRLANGLYGSEIVPSAINGRLSPRLSNKLDAFTRYALVATESALGDAGLVLDEIDRTRCGVFVGNSFGGWQFTETQLRNLHCEGPRAVSPFQATSWFPAAPQGQITILHGIKGHSKTYMADRASSLLSVAAGARQIQLGQLDVAIAGGTESTNTQFVRLALASLAARDGDRGPEAFRIAEGAVFLVLEEQGRALSRGARIYAKIGRSAMFNAPCDGDRYSDDPELMKSVMRKACAEDIPDVIMPDACGLIDPDRAERQALHDTFKRVPTVVPKARTGHTFGAEGALDIAFACLMLDRGRTLPRCPVATSFDACPGTDLPGQGVVPKRILVNARATGGAACSLMLHGAE
ncbi:3-oxoacyl-[acyl-carrier-protein] synthase 2 [Paraburkholderia caffeinitolerans]|uniref:3-oxoacyl-[acyl-carrier-protein] synthase 2 n=1 Tax=Paraburkholderia caffeinitolerans TaxID=1723730 RepID=A0A6J5GNS4_9BURK|nr:beta-ketoacyl synthase N-terminal-like domain-containing protein [Paraburkholderia caffeinitolerans]CAB3800773.1 3-oxoacyl-[acyl-carrier-protein] synthase 2 [Paraburkholderia caffeinitolerans]